MITETKVTRCVNCPFWNRDFQVWSRDFKDGCEFTHPDAPKNYGNLVGPYYAEHHRPPVWCPLRKEDYKQYKRIYLKDKKL
jgi:hypothetical protein